MRGARPYAARPMRIALSRLEPLVGDPDGNVARMTDAAIAAVRDGAQLVAFPELAVCGYPPRDLLQRAGFVEACGRALGSMAESLAAAGAGDALVVVGCPMRAPGGRAINAACALRGGRVEAVHAKRLLPQYDVFDEPRHFLGETDPRPVDVGGLRLGITVCEDLWHLPGFTPDSRYRVDPVAALGRCDVHLNLSASPFHAGKQRERVALVRAQARRAGAPLVYVNQVGGNDHLLFDGGSLAADADGRVIAAAPQFAPARVVVELGGAPVEPTFLEVEEEWFRALVLGVRDYVRRSGFRSAVLGLSGGIDSALVAAIAVEALGAENVLGVGLPGPFSSEGSLTDARALAEALGVRFEVVPITPAWDALREALAPVFGPGPGGLAEENLQARVRGTLLMALSNKLGHMLLTTGNKSELAVGYCTLYGDMNGALAVIGDLYKTEVYRLSRWVNRERELIPESTLTKPPSAELAPGQTDQDSLPPYEVLDAVLRRLVEAGDDVAALTADGFDPAVVERVARLVRLAEYKRWQAPPTLRLTRKAFGAGRRMPLAAVWR